MHLIENRNKELHLKRTTKFCSIADEWLEKLKSRPESQSSYASAKERMATLKQYFAGCLLDQISPRMIANFYKYLGERTHTKAVVTIKKPIKVFLKEQHLTMGNLADDCQLNRLTIRVANKVGL
jgi:hypothetical protein